MQLTASRLPWVDDMSMFAMIVIGVIALILLGLCVLIADALWGEPG